jgi:ATP synthase protein I
VFNSLGANRRLAVRTVTVQSLVASAIALGFLVVGTRECLAAALGGGAVALGSLVLAWRSMFGPALQAGTVLARMISGLLLKWFVVVAALFLGLARWDLPPLPLLAGLAATLAASFPIHAMKS